MRKYFIILLIAISTITISACDEWPEWGEPVNTVLDSPVPKPAPQPVRQKQECHDWLAKLIPSLCN